MGGVKTKLDMGQLREEIQGMTPKKQIYQVLQEELSKLGRWKMLPRGKPNPRFVKKSS